MSPSAVDMALLVFVVAGGPRALESPGAVNMALFEGSLLRCELNFLDSIGDEISNSV